MRRRRNVEEAEELKHFHIMMHLLGPCEVLGPFTESATLAASVNASLTPRLRFAEHSTPVSPEH